MSGLRNRLLPGTTWAGGFFVTLASSLLIIGLGVLASASIAVGEKGGEASYVILIKQAVFAAVGIVAGGVFARLDYRRYERMAIPLGVAAIFLLGVTKAFGPLINGARRWLRFGPVQLQTSELAKVALCIALAAWLSRHRRRTDRPAYGLFVPLLIIGALAGSVFIGPDYGTTALMGGVGVILMFLSGARIGPLLLSVSIAVQAFLYAMMHSVVRLKRIISFLNPGKYEGDESYQLSNALYAFIMGGPRGVGYGHGMQQRFYLPEAHTDFIYAVIGEEGGMPATLLLASLYLLLFFCGLQISRHAHDAFGRLLALGLTLMLSLQAVFNMGVVTGLLPTKGLPLPFISYGGSSLVMSCVMVGILINITRMTSSLEMIEQASPVKDRVRFG